MTKKTLTLRSGPHYEIDGLPLGQAIVYLQNLQAEYGEGAEIDYLVRWEGDTYFEVVHTREETDEEYNKRLADEAHLAQRQQDYRRKQYEELKKEFENG